MIAHSILVLSNLNILSDIARKTRIDAGPFLGDGNDFAFSLSLIIPFALFFLCYEKKIWHKIFIFQIVLVLTIGIFMTQSRGGILAFAGIAMFLVLSSKHKLTGLIIILMTTLVLYAAFPRIATRMQTLAKYKEDASARGRLDAWNASIKMGLDKPLTGVGLGNFAVAYGLYYRPANAYHQYSWLVAHSLYFQMIGELGFPGIIFLLCVLSFNYWDIVISYLSSKFDYNYEPFQKFPIYLTALMIALMIGGTFLSCITYPHIYIYSALIVSFRKSINHKRIYL
jgi:O-antigen ligase